MLMRKIITLFFAVLYAVGAMSQNFSARQTSVGRPVADVESNSGQFMAGPISQESDLVQMVTPTCVQATLPGANAQFQKLSAPAMASVTTEKLVGFMSNPNKGFGAVKPDGTFEMKLPITDGRVICSMAVVDKKVCAFSYLNSPGKVKAFYTEYDLDSWEQLYELDLTDHYGDGLIQSGGYVPEDGIYYGFGYDKGIARWIKFNVTTHTFTSEVTDTPYQNFMTYNTLSHKMVSIDSKGNLNEINKENAALTNLAALQMTSPFKSSMAYDISSDKYIWIPAAFTGTKMVSIDPATYAVEDVANFAFLNQFSALFCYETKPTDPKGPKAPEWKGADFVGNQKTGHVKYGMPAELNDGSAISGNIEYVLSVNDKEYKTGTVSPGTDVSVEIGSDAGLSDGLVKFEIFCKQGEHEGKSRSNQAYVGNDTPMPPANVTLSADNIGELSWSPVEKGVHDGYLELDKLTYTVKVNGKTVASGITGTKCVSGILANNEMAVYSAEVTAACNGMVSEPGKSKDVIYGSALELPAYLAPTPREKALFTILDNNWDSQMWTLMEDADSYGTAFRYAYDSYNEADDWLILPPVAVNNPDKYLKFSFDAWCQQSNIPESFEVYFGKENNAEAMMDNKIMDQTIVNYTWDNRRNHDMLFKVDEPGKYYVAVRATSPKDRFYLFVNNFRLSETDIDIHGPAAVTDIRATQGEKGALNAEVSFRLPAKTNIGTELQGKVDVTIKSPAETLNISGEPGETKTIQIKTVQGNNNISIQASQDNTTGMVAYVNVWGGVDIPGVVTGLTAHLEADNVTGKLTWSAPTEGAYGRYIEDSGYDYYLMQPVTLPLIGTIWNNLGLIGTDVCEFEFKYPAEMAQQKVQLGILAASKAGAAENLSVCTFSVGKPYDTPMDETFHHGSQVPAYDYNPVSLVLTDYAAGNASVSLAKAANLTNPGAPYDYALQFTCQGKQGVDIILPKVSTKNQSNVTFIPNMYIGSAKNVSVMVETYDEPMEKIFNSSTMVNLSEGYHDIALGLPSKFQNKEWVTLHILAEMDEDHSVFTLGGYKVMNYVAKDLSVKVNGPVKIDADRSSTFTARVTNVGFSGSRYTGGVVKVADSTGKVIYTQQVEGKEELPEGASVDIDFSFTPQLANVGNAVVTYELSSQDDNALNNAGSLAVEIGKGHPVVAKNLKGEYLDDKIHISWDAAEYYYGDSWEGYEPFKAIDGKIGEWTAIDSGKDAYTWNGIESNLGLAALLDEMLYKPGFHVFDSKAFKTYAGEANALPAADGDQYLLIFCPMDESAADDWLISPELQGGSAFSFQAKPMTLNFGSETVEVLYSKEAGDDPENFELLESFDVNNREWTKYELLLPSDARRIALHYVSENKFGLMLDDMRYVPAEGLPSVSGYDVYRASEDSDEFTKVTSVLSNGATDDTASINTTNRYYVIPLLDNGKQGIASDILVMQPSGVNNLTASGRIIGGKNEIAIYGYDGMDIQIVNASGIVICTLKGQASNRVPVAPGVYTVKISNAVAKVLVK